MQNIAIIGASGGIGLAITRTLSKQHPSARIWATYRSNVPAADCGKGVRWLPLDLEDDHSIAQASRSLLSDTPSLDLLLVCSGWLHDSKHMPEKSLKDVDAHALAKAIRINAIGPLVLIGKLSAALTRARDVDGSRARIIALSAKVGSIEDNNLGGWHGYRMSKAALNMGIRNCGIEFARSGRKPLIAAVHPGTTQTALSDPFAKQGLTVVSTDVTAKRLLNFAAGMSDAHQGGFFHWDGTPIPY